MSLRGCCSISCYDRAVTDIPSNAVTSGEVTVGGTIGQRPDGKHVGVFTMATDNCSFQVALPADALDSMGAKLGPMLGDLATAVRRADSPLLVAKSVPTPGGKKK